MKRNHEDHLSPNHKAKTKQTRTTNNPINPDLLHSFTHSNIPPITNTTQSTINKHTTEIPQEPPRTSTPINHTTTLPQLDLSDIEPTNSTHDTKNTLLSNTHPTITMAKPTDLPQYVKKALGYKKEGLIRISIHRSRAFDTKEMKSVLKNLGVTEILSNENNDKLLIALAKTGNLDTYANDPNQLLNTMDMNEDTYASFDQQTQVNAQMLVEATNKSTQVNEMEIITCAKILNITQAKTFNIPPLVLNTQPTIITMNKPAEVVFNTKAFINYSDRQIPQSVAIILSFGPKFSVPTYYRQEDFIDLRDTAYAINEAFAQPHDINSIRTHIDKHITEYNDKQYTQHANEIRDYFTIALGETKHFLRNNKDLILTQADKANASIIMDRNTYINKVEQLLADNSTYAPLKQSSNAAYQKINQKLLEKMTKIKWITEKEAEESAVNETKTANIYAFIKTHKTGNPPRPIVNTINTPGYTLAKKVTNKLSKGRNTTRYNVLNSRMAIDHIKSTRILPDMEFRSYDARSMFTNITAEKALQAVIKRKDRLGLNDEGLQLTIDVIKFACLQSTEIAFNNAIYKQIKGLRMGSSLSPVLAEFVMDDLLDKIFLQIQRPHFFTKYVDDILTVTTKEHHEQILTALNNADEDLKFDQEKQDDQNQINYLDFTIINQPFNVKTKWFQKHIASGRLLNFHTHHPKSVIWHTAVNFISTMIYNSHPDFLNDIIARAQHLLHINSYPKEYRERVITTAIEKNDKMQPITSSQPQMRSTNIPNPSQKQQPIYVPGLPYLPKITNKIQKHIEYSASQPSTSMTQEGYPRTPKNIKIASKPTHRMSKETYNKHKKIGTTQNTTCIDIEDANTPQQNTFTQP